VRDEGGELPLVDRTDRLCLSEARLSALTAVTADIIYRASPDWSEMREVDGRGVIASTLEPSKNWMDFYVAPEDQPPLQAAIDRAIATRGVFEAIAKVRRLDGSTGWVHSRAVPMFDTNGEIYEWLGTARDLTDRREMEEKLARLTAESESQRRFFEAMISGTPDLI